MSKPLGWQVGWDTGFGVAPKKMEKKMKKGIANSGKNRNRPDPNIACIVENIKSRVICCYSASSGGQLSLQEWKFPKRKTWKMMMIIMIRTNKFVYYIFDIEKYLLSLQILNTLLSNDFVFVDFCINATRVVCGDLGINNKTPNRILTRRLPDTKCINASPRIRLHASIRLKSEKRKIIKK